jgi:hypothetical protein
MGEPEEKGQGKDIVQVVNETVGISEDVDIELKNWLKRDRELQKLIEEIDVKRREEFESLQREIASLLEES